LNVRLVTGAADSKRTVAVATLSFTVFVEFIPLWHTTLKLTYVLPPTTAHFISFVNIFCMFPS